jgi:uncharacterized protein YraI
MKLTRLSFCAGALVMLSATCAPAAPAFVATTVNLRAGPGTTHEIVARIPGGSLVDAANCADGWCAVAWQGKSGYAIQTAIDLSGRVPSRHGPPVIYEQDPGYVVGPPVYYGPPRYYRPRPYYYGGPRWGW